MRAIDADELLKNYQEVCKSIRCYDCQFNGEWGDKGCQLEAMINNAPTVEAVPKNMVFHVDTYDDMEEEYTKKEMTLEELLDKFTDEGYPNTLNALDALEDEDEDEIF